jgi:hypothetical protein
VAVRYFVEEKEVGLLRCFFNMWDCLQPTAIDSKTPIPLLGKEGDDCVRMVVELSRPFSQHLTENDGA